MGVRPGGKWAEDQTWEGENRRRHDFRQECAPSPKWSGGERDYRGI